MMCLHFTGLYTPFVYLRQKSLSLGSNENEASSLLMMLGAFNAFGRVASGYLADHPRVDAININNVAAIVMGISTAVVSVLNSWGLLMGYAAIFALAMGLYEFIYRRIQ